MERSDAPLLNRATQASYPIGSLATMLAFESVWSNQTAVQVFDPRVLTRYDSACYETIKVNELALDGVQAGCMSTAIDHLTASDPKLLLKNLTDFGIFSVPDLVIQCGQPPLAPELDQLDRNPELVTQLQVSPAQMALVAAAITNNGIQPPPGLVNAYLNPEGRWVEINAARPSTEVMAQSVARRIRNELASTNQALWYQMGHATIHEDQALTWLIGGTTSEWLGTPLAIVIALEENAPPDLPQSLGGILLDFSSTE